jgi:probable phosphoglycerate mutase
VTDDDLVEWNYGRYEGATSEDIHRATPGWQIFRDGAPGGETPEQVGNRVDRVIARVRDMRENVAVFSYGHLLRVLVTRWIGLPPAVGAHFLLDTATVSILATYGDVRSIGKWNCPQT